MKQLSLLLLAGLTTGCFAAQDAPKKAQPKEFAKCWEFINGIADNYKYVGSHIKSIIMAQAYSLIDKKEGFQECILAQDRIERMSNNPSISYRDRKALNLVRKAILQKKNLQEMISIEEAAAQDEAEQNRLALANSR